MGRSRRGPVDELLDGLDDEQRRMALLLMAIGFSPGNTRVAAMLLANDVHGVVQARLLAPADRLHARRQRATALEVRLAR